MIGSEICNKLDLCTGCYTCMNVCPKEAITFTRDKEGFSIPYIDTNKCIDCHLCQKRCPANNPSKPVPLPIVKTSIFKDNNNDFYLKASSGGAFGVLARYVINQGGCVFGCVMDSDYQIYHVKAKTLEDISLFHGSKYVQSNIGFTFRDCKKELQNGNFVLFSGCPCQIDGLRHYLNKDYDNLITVDLICHGVPNQKLFSEFIKWFYQNKQTRNYQFYKFRYKFRSEEEKSLIYRGYGNDDFFIKFYVWGKIFRKACYKCRYAGTQRVGDFTIGDFWENFAVKLNIEEDKSYSKILFNTSKALQYTHLFQTQGFYYELTPEETKLSNRGPLSAPSPKNLRRDIIYSLFRMGGIKAVATFYKINRAIIKLKNNQG